MEVGDGTPPAAQCCTLTQKSVRGLGDPSPGNGSSSLAAQTGTQPTTDGRPFNRSTPPAMEFHLLEAEAAAGSPVGWLSLFLCSVGASRARGSWSAQAGGKATWAQSVQMAALAKRESDARGIAPPTAPPQSRLRSLFKDFSRGKFMIHPVPRPHLQVGPGLPGSGPGADPLSKLCCGSPQPRHSLGLGLGIKGFQDFLLDMSSPQEAEQSKRNHTQGSKKNLIRKRTGILPATPSGPSPSPAPSSAQAAAATLC